ncbi:hypothetical protein Tco_1454333 [Tanacetum coccineum]
MRACAERIVIASGPGFSDWLLQSTGLQTKLLWHSDIVTSGPAFDNALSAFNEKIKIDLLSNPSKVAAPKHLKKLADICFTRVTQMAEYTFSLSTRQMALWKSQMEDHTSDWLRVVPISGRAQLAPGSLRGIFMVTMLISAGKEVDIGLGSSPLTQTGIINFVPGHAVIEASQRKRVKYEDKCANIGYGFLPFSISSFGELEKDAVTLLKWIQKFSVTQNIRARTAIHIFSRISFAIARGVEAQIVSRLPTNFL